jgi:adenylate cyclase
LNATMPRTAETVKKAQARILIVEDEAALRGIEARALARPGWEILEAADAREARALLLASKVDLLISDVTLPGDTDGMDLFRWTRGNCPGVEVIILTGNPTLEGALEAFRFGAIDYVVKPADFDHLRQAAKRAVERNRAADELKTEKELREALQKTYRELMGMDGMRETLRRYLTREVADKILASPTAEGVKSERRNISVLFADIRRFTTFAESRPPEEAIQALNSVFERLNRVVSRHGGIISKFTGDGMMVLFGAPLDQPDHSQRAVGCAVEMRREAKAWNEERVRCGTQPLGMGIGICSGDVVAGSLGSIERTEYTVIGSTVNLAARLEEKAAAGQILLNPLAAASAGGLFPIKSLGLLWMDGFTKSVSVFEVSQTEGV